MKSKNIAKFSAIAFAMMAISLTNKLSAQSPSFTKVEGQLMSLQSSQSLGTRAAVALSGSYAFTDNFFAQLSMSKNDTASFADTNYTASGKTRNVTDIGIGLRRDVGAASAFYGSVGMRSSNVQRIGVDSTQVNSIYSRTRRAPRATLGLRTLWGEKIESDVGISTLEESSSNNRITALSAKGTYFVTDNVGLSMELGLDSGDGDTGSGLGLRYNF